jgi:endonuclease G
VLTDLEPTESGRLRGSASFRLSAAVALLALFAALSAQPPPATAAADEPSKHWVAREPGPANTLSDDLHCYYGVAGPQGQFLDREFFVINYHNRWRTPYWVSYYTSTALLEGDEPRTDDYRYDDELEPESVRALPSDYAGSNCDQGHLAPADDFARSFDAMSTTFLLSNMSPQRKRTNRGIWRTLEGQVHRMVKKLGEAWIVTGNAFLPDGEPDDTQWTYPERKRLAIPTHLFKALLVRETGGRWRMYAFIIPNQADWPKGSRPYAFRVSVNALEKLTGLDFFPLLPDTMEERLEKTRPRNWPK